MSTHYHLLAWIENSDTLPRLIKSLHVSYNYYYCHRYTYKGHLWHSRYRSINVEREEHWLQCARYIELNPVYAGICKYPWEYKSSSYHHYAFGKKDDVVQPVIYVPESNCGKVDEVDCAYRDFILAGMDLDYQRQKKIYEKEMHTNLHKK